MARSDWSDRRRAEVVRRIESLAGHQPRPTGRRPNVIKAADQTYRLGFGQGQTASPRGIKGFPRQTTETFYLAVPAPADASDIVVAVVGDAELVFTAPDFLKVTGEPDGNRYLPNFFRDHRDGSYWARVADLDLNYPLDDFVGRWTPETASNPAPGSNRQRSGRASEEDLLADFKPGNSSEYIARIEGREIVKSRQHERLVADFGLWTAERGFRPSTVEFPRDLVLRKAGIVVLVEAKVLYRGNATDAVRAAVGQLLTYRHFLHASDPQLCLLALFSEPVGAAYERFLDSVGVESVWREDSSWNGSASSAALGLVVAHEWD
jgi:hypothetical protein